MQLNSFIKLSTWLIYLTLVIPNLSIAQPGGGGMRRDPAQMIKAEKKLMYDSLKTLNKDQKLILDQIYTDYELAFTNAFENADPSNREAMRETMMAIRDEKNESLMAILTEEQFLKFEAIMKARRDKMRQKRGSRDQ